MLACHLLAWAHAPEDMTGLGILLTPPSMHVPTALPDQVDYPGELDHQHDQIHFITLQAEHPGPSEAPTLAALKRTHPPKGVCRAALS